MARRPGALLAPPPIPSEIHLARDHPRGHVAAMVRNGTWVRVRRGAMVAAADVVGPDGPRRLALARVVAAARMLSPDHVISHTSAALLWGLPTLRVPARTHVVTRCTARAGASADLVRHSHRLGADDVTVLNGIRVTTLERTLVDCATSETVRGGVVVADAALHRGADVERCHDLVSAMAGHRGVAHARLVLQVADGGAESAGESLARVALLEVGAPVPETQVAVRTSSGTYWADLGWREHRLLGEYDGESKYRGGAAVVVAEKRREDVVLDEGWRVLRLTKVDTRDRRLLTARLHRALPGLKLTPRPWLAL